MLARAIDEHRDNERNPQSVFRSLSGAGRWRKKRGGCARSGKPCRMARSQKSRAIFAGVWGVPNKQSDRAGGAGTAVGISQRDIPTDCLQRLAEPFG